MDTTYIGRTAEQAAGDFLLREGYRIVDRNWRRRECEIDIVASKAGFVYFVEVKYRASDTAGNGLEYIASAKLRRMEYAARRWVAAHDWRGGQILAAIEVSGPEYAVTAFIDCVY